MLRKAFLGGATLMLTLILMGSGNDSPGVQKSRPPEIQYRKTDRLERFYRKHDYTLENIQDGQYIVVEAFPDDFHTLRNVNRKKRLFHLVVLPLIYLENRRLRRIRNHLIELRDHHRKGILTPGEVDYLKRTMKDYHIPDEEGPSSNQPLRDSWFRSLLRRVHAFPPSLVLAQAANESGWGTSRFARKANNIFGEYTYNEEAGLKPAGVDGSVDYRIRVFPSLRSSVRSYMHNLNTGWAYEKFRHLRYRREDGMNSLNLARGLKRYSERGQAYVRLITALIKSNNYRRFDQF